MATRRRSYRGTPEQHAEDAKWHTRLLRGGIKATRQYLRDGDCANALRALTAAHRESGAQRDAFKYAPRSKAAQRYSPLPRRSEGSLSLIFRLNRDFIQKCMK